nr:hypothetical protein GCM10020092_087700 [Actinoplanes digitatis]
MLLADVAYALHGADDGEEAGRVAEEAIAAAAEIGDASTQVSATITFGQVCGGRMSPDEGLPSMTAAAALARENGDLPNLARALVNVSDALFELGRYEESAAAAAEGIPYADRVGVHRTTGVFLLANHAEALIALGRWDEADARCAEAARLDPPGTLALPWLRMRARLRLARGHEGAEPTAHRAIAFLSRPFLHRENRLALLELRILVAQHADDATEALTAARQAVTEPAIADRPRYGWPVLAAAATTAAESRDEDLTARIRQVAADLPRRYGADRAYAAQVDAALEGRPELWRDAVTAWRADGQRHPLAVALLGLANAAAERRRPRSRGRGAGGGGGHRGRTRRRSPHHGRRHPGAAHRTALGGPTGADGTQALTDREREVLRLVAEGRSNSRIAQQLYISPKTASVHVSRIIAKLEVANRGEAAAVAHRLGLID